MIYLDYSAHTPPSDEALRVFLETERECIGNPNSRHSAGRYANGKIREATQRIARILGVGDDEIIFTSGSTEANNLALKGAARALRHKGRHIISTPLEHSSVSAALTALQEQGYEIDILKIDRDGKVSLDNLKELLRKDTVIVSVCAVDSELGTIQPTEKIAERVSLVRLSR